MKSGILKSELNLYLPLLSERQQQLILDMVKSILHVDKKEKRVSLDQYNTEIDEAIQELKDGKGISHDKVMKQNRKWLKRK